jgi:UDP-N-acetylmuramoyl-tripeptide--D-alanyl-D-alanine ligase
MKSISIAQLRQWVGGKELRGSDSLCIKGVSTDSRTLSPGELFIPLRGERFDGHDFVSSALRQGAAAVLIEEQMVSDIKTRLMSNGLWEQEPNIMTVPDTLLALQGIARGYRSLFTPKVIGITGSTGKTTTKDMTASIASQIGPFLKSQENYNNEIGLPLTLLQLEPNHKTVVVEMAMRGPGQIRTLTKIARPSVGVITNVGTVHLELLGSQRAIQRAKQELVETMEPGSTIVLNADEPLVREMAEAASDKKVIYYGWQSTNHDKLNQAKGCQDTSFVTATHLVTHGAKGVSFTLCYRGKSIDIKLPVPGRYQVSNALAAAAAAMAVGASLTDVQMGLARVILSSMRMQIIPWLDGGLIINDTYNANPTSMAAAIKTAHEIAAHRPLILVLGDMLELGQLSEEAHLDIGRQTVELKPAYLVCVGTEAKGFAKGAEEAGMSSGRIVECENHKEAQEVVLQLAKPGDVILVKGSRGMALENVVLALHTRP